MPIQFDNSQWEQARKVIKNRFALLTMQEIDEAREDLFILEKRLAHAYGFRPKHAKLEVFALRETLKSLMSSFAKPRNIDEMDAANPAGLKKTA